MRTQTTVFNGWRVFNINFNKDFNDTQFTPIVDIII